MPIFRRKSEAMVVLMKSVIALLQEPFVHFLFTRTWQPPPTDAELKGLVDDYVAGTNITGFVKVIDAMLDQGVV